MLGSSSKVDVETCSGRTEHPLLIGSEGQEAGVPVWSPTHSGPPEFWVPRAVLLFLLSPRPSICIQWHLAPPSVYSGVHTSLESSSSLYPRPAILLFPGSLPTLSLSSTSIGFITMVMVVMSSGKTYFRGPEDDTWQKHPSHPNSVGLSYQFTPTYSG